MVAADFSSRSEFEATQQSGLGNAGNVHARHVECTHRPGQRTKTMHPATATANAREKNQTDSTNGKHEQNQGEGGREK